MSNQSAVAAPLTTSLTAQAIASSASTAASSSTAQATGESQTTNSQQLTEINLNEPAAATAGATAATVAGQTASANPAYEQCPHALQTDFPPAGELPSYSEAVRQKKLEASANETPPSYFPSPYDPSQIDSRIHIDPIDVRTWFFLYSNFI